MIKNSKIGAVEISGFLISIYRNTDDIHLVKPLSEPFTNRLSAPSCVVELRCSEPSLALQTISFVHFRNNLLPLPCNRKQSSLFATKTNLRFSISRFLFCGSNLFSSDERRCYHGKEF